MVTVWGATVSQFTKKCKYVNGGLCGSYCEDAAMIITF
jgi:hypothetical protein